jgi:hypothetical protein
MKKLLIFLTVFILSKTMYAAFSEESEDIFSWCACGNASEESRRYYNQNVFDFCKKNFDVDDMLVISSLSSGRLKQEHELLKVLKKYGFRNIIFNLIDSMYEKSHRFYEDLIPVIECFKKTHEDVRVEFYAGVDYLITDKSLISLKDKNHIVLLVDKPLAYMLNNFEYSNLKVNKGILECSEYFFSVRDKQKYPKYLEKLSERHSDPILCSLAVFTEVFDIVGLFFLGMCETYFIPKPEYGCCFYERCLFCLGRKI